MAGRARVHRRGVKLLEQMNRVTATKYSDMRQITANVSKGVEQLNDKYRELQPYLEQVDQIEESVARLEAAAFKLDSYSKRLEAKSARIFSPRKAFRSSSLSCKTAQGRFTRFQAGNPIVQMQV